MGMTLEDIVAYQDAVKNGIIANHSRFECWSCGEKINSGERYTEQRYGVEVLARHHVTCNTSKKEEMKKIRIKTIDAFCGIS